MTGGISLLIEPVVRTFGRRILFVVTVALAIALLVTAVVVAVLAERAAREESERRFADLAGGALLDLILDEGRDVRDSIVKMNSPLLIEATSNGRGDEFEVSMRAAEMIDVGMLQVLREPGFAAIAPDGRLLWNKIARDERGTDWTRHDLVRAALAGTHATIVISPRDSSVPPIVRDAERLHVVTAIPMSLVSPGQRGAWLVARPVSLDDLAGFASATGVEVELRGHPLVERSPALLTLPSSFDAGEGKRVRWGPETYWAKRMEIRSADGRAVATATLFRPITAEVRLVRRIWTGVAAVFLFALAAGMLLGRAFAAPLSRSVEKLVEGSDAFRQRRYGHRIQVATKDELATLADSLNAMAAQLEKGEFIERTMRISVPRKYLDYILLHRDELGLDGANRDVSVLFCDLGGFTHFAEGKDPAEVVKSINDYFDVCTRVIETHDGMVDKFIGDAVMGIWNAPVAVADHPGKALIAALELANATEYVISTWRAPEKLRIRVGVHSGPAIAGHIGARAHQQPYSVVGDTVNLASRLEATNKIYGTRVLTTRATRERAGDSVEARFVDRVRLAGRDEPVDLFEVLCEAGSPSPPRAPAPEYQAAWDLYAAKRHSEAADAFAALVARFPEDGPAVTMAARTLRYARTAPEDFDGIFTMERK